MNEENDAYLTQKYPKIFSGRRRPPQETAMYWGFECGDGWLKLLDTLCNDIQTLVDQHGLEQPVAVQVKEKFGALRFHVNSADERIYALIDDAEALSSHVCESCGVPASITQYRGWYRCLCTDCVTKQGLDKPDNL